eukprot:6173770-Pleurochrysis_carterae.AAC.1
MQRCHYEVLGLPRDAQDDDIRKAYRRLALQRMRQPTWPLTLSSFALPLHIPRPLPSRHPPSLDPSFEKRLLGFFCRVACANTLARIAPSLDRSLCSSVALQLLLPQARHYLHSFTTHS